MKKCTSSYRWSLSSLIIFYPAPIVKLSSFFVFSYCQSLCFSKRISQIQTKSCSLKISRLCEKISSTWSCFYQRASVLHISFVDSFFRIISLHGVFLAMIRHMWIVPFLCLQRGHRLRLSVRVKGAVPSRSKFSKAMMKEVQFPQSCSKRLHPKSECVPQTPPEETRGYQIFIVSVLGHGSVCPTSVMSQTWDMISLPPVTWFVQRKQNTKAADNYKFCKAEACRPWFSLKTKRRCWHFKAEKCHHVKSVITQKSHSSIALASCQFDCKNLVI